LDKTIAFGKNTLKGLAGVAVNAEMVTPPGLSLAEIDNEKLRQAIEDQIYQSGIVVISMQGLAGVIQKPILHVKLSLLPVGAGNHVYAINSFLMQRAALVVGDSTLAVTWEHGYLGLKMGEEWQSIYSSLEKTIARFIAEFKEVNQLP
jgi:hypothetical protein